MQKIQISELHDQGDARGFSFVPPREAFDFLGRISDMHLASTAPGGVRGNHYHLRKRQAIIFLPGTAWSFYWDSGEGTLTQHRSFDGNSAILALISPGCSNAVRNDGSALLWLVACSSEAYDPSQVVARKLI
jgi:dTDP-4-dehydrorhamnose 3,5-epimerase-like enzyme